MHLRADANVVRIQYTQHYTSGTTTLYNKQNFNYNPSEDIVVYRVSKIGL